MSVETLGATTASSRGTLITSGAANTKGSYAELVASTAQASDGFVLGYSNASSVSDFLIDIATGAAGAETVIVANVPFNSSAQFKAHAQDFARAVGTGVRVASRCQCTTASATMDVIVYAWQLGATLRGGATTADTYGAATADSGGTSVDPGAVAHTKGAYSELTASSAGATEELGVTIGNQNNAARSSAFALCDIASGAAGAETVVLANLMLHMSSSSDTVTPIAFPSLPLVIANATRIAARGQCSITTATARLWDVIVHATRGAAASGGGSGGGLRLAGHGGLAA